MYSLKRYAIILPSIIILAGCATFTNSDSEKAPYYEASFDDKNRAPSSFLPAFLKVDNNQESIDPLYLQTQADYNFSMGETYSLDGNSTKSIEFFKLALIYDQNSPSINIRLAGEYLKQGMISESLAQAEIAANKDPKNSDAHLLLGGLYSTLKRYPKALEQYHQVLKINPENTEAPLYIGALYSEQKQPDKAIKYFETLLKNPEYQSPHLIHYYIGRVELEQDSSKHQKAAERSFKQAISIKPDFADATLSLGTLYNRQKHPEKAIALYRSFQKENTPSPKIAELLAQTFIEQEKYDQAYEQLEFLDQASDDPLNVKMKMALILIEQKKYSLAVEKLTQILELAPESDKVRFYLGAVYEETHESDKAINEFKQIDSTSTFFTDAVVHTAYLLKNKGQLNEAVDIAAKSLKQRSDQPQIYAMYASLLDEKTDYVAAAKLLEQGLEKFPDNTQLRFYYGTINDRLGKKEVVINEMKKLIELDPNHVQGLNYLAFTWAEQNVHLSDAEKLARRALAIEPQDGYVLDTLGWILFKQNKYNESIKFLEAAYKSQGAVSVIAEHLGDAYYKQSMVEKAKKMYKRAADLETNKSKIQEINNKITGIERQELNTQRVPASVQSSLAEEFK